MSIPEYPPLVLVADDDEEDSMLIKRAFASCSHSETLHFVKNGEELMDYLHRRGSFARPNAAPRPTLILLDLKMPRKDGREALREIKADASLRSIPVVVMTTSSAQVEARTLYAMGASSYITKPVRLAEWAETLDILRRYWFELVSLPTENESDHP